ncbi:MAG: hypothetical protein IJR91_01650 [Ruminococcus sp.]|nr:hypothetical protein [Ruminococcus sp.]
MSKKDRLKKQSQQQLNAKKIAERSEQLEHDSPRESKSARKMRRNAKKMDSAVTLLLKLLMCVPFLWSGLYYGGIFVLGISMGQMDDVPGYVAALIGVGAALCLVGLVLAFLSKYIPQFAFILVGTVVYMQGASYIIDKAVTRVGEGIGLTEEQKEFPSKWRFGLYPIMLMTALSAVLLIIWIVRKLRAKHRRQKDFDNSPVKSIVED